MPYYQSWPGSPAYLHGGSGNGDNGKTTMAESAFRLPSQLNITDGNISENFRKWKRQVEIYMAATGSDA